MKIKPRTPRRSRAAGGVESSPAASPAVVHNVVAPLRSMIVPIVELKLDPANAKRHPRAQIEALANTMRELGQHRPAVFRARDRVVVIGNGMLEAARLLGWTHVAAFGLEDSAAESVARALADNRTADLGEWDPVALRASFATLPEPLAAIAWFGGDMPPLPPPLDPPRGHSAIDGDRDSKPTTTSDANEAKREAGLHQAGGMLGGGYGEEPDVDLEDEDEETITRAIEARSVPQRCRVGDLWEIGKRHFLVIGDITKPHVLPELLAAVNARKAGADMVWTDPPFAIYGSSTGVDQSVADDSMVAPFFRAMNVAIAGSVRARAHVYICCDWRSYPSIREEAKGVLVAKNMILWQKSNMTRHAYHYGHCHELISFFVKEPRATSMFHNLKDHRRVFDSNVWQCKVIPAVKRWHFAEKPQGNIKRAITNSTDKGEIVLDPFAGSGSTLIASHELDRVCLLAEKMPSTADRILFRIEQELGLDARKVRTIASE